MARAVYSFTRGSTRLYSGFLGSNKVMELECFILGFGASSSGSTMASAFGLSVLVPLILGSLPFCTSNPNAFCDLFFFVLQKIHQREFFCCKDFTDVIVRCFFDKILSKTYSF